MRTLSPLVRQSFGESKDLRFRRLGTVGDEGIRNLREVRLVSRKIGS